jgi:hypothetical protein
MVYRSVLAVEIKIWEMDDDQNIPSPILMSIKGMHCNLEHSGDKKELV